jgi:hypothetical protein
LGKASLRASARLLQARLFKAVFFFVSFPRRGRLKEIDFHLIKVPEEDRESSPG